MWDRANRSGCTRHRCRATNSRGPLEYIVALHYRGTSNQARASWIRRKGFLRRTGLLQLLEKETHENINRESPPGGTHSQVTAPACLLRPPLSGTAHSACDESNCHVFLIFRRTEIIDKGLVPCPHLDSIHYHLFSSVGEEKPPQTSEKEGAKQPNLRPHSTVESGLAIQNTIPLSESNFIP